MGTRGVFGFRVGGEDKLLYNHWDSYPRGLGAAMLAFAKKIAQSDRALADAMNRAYALVGVGNETPTPEDIEMCQPYTDLSVSERSTSDWYCLLRGTQGKPDAVLTVGLAELANDFIRDSLFCEWAYIINFDELTLEVYTGFQSTPHRKGRYSTQALPKPDDGQTHYQPCALVATYPLTELPKSLNHLEAAEAIEVDKEEEGT